MADCEVKKVDAQANAPEIAFSVADAHFDNRFLLALFSELVILPVYMHDNKGRPTRDICHTKECTGLR